MLTFFRRIRKGLLEGGATSKYLLYAIGEIALVVIGILIALQINNWNSKQIEKVLEREYLTNLLSDLNEDESYILKLLKDWQFGLEYGTSILHIISLDTSLSVKVKSLNDYFDNTGVESFVLQRSTYKDLESSGSLRLIRNTSLRNQIIRHYTLYDLTKEEFTDDYNWEQSFNVNMDLSTSIIKYDDHASEIFKGSDLLDYSDMVFLKNPHHELFQIVVTTIAARSWTMNTQAIRTNNLLEPIRNLMQLIKEELGEFE